VHMEKWHWEETEVMELSPFSLVCVSEWKSFLLCARVSGRSRQDFK